MSKTKVDDGPGHHPPKKDKNKERNASDRKSTDTETDLAEENAAERKQTVLESHGYTIGYNIGKGSYATVKSGYSERHLMKVAIKIVSKTRAPEDYLRKFLPREIQVVKGLKHQNLINFLQAIETTHRVYLIMELAENGNLLDHIRQNRYIREPKARRWFGNLIDAIDYCHGVGVVHRDIKCENLLLDSKFRLKVTDFGFARGSMQPGADGVYPLSETFCGSYAYASPEILRGTPYVPQLSDVWSMGVVLFAMTFGRLPFDDTNHKTLLKQVQSEVVFPIDPPVTQPLKILIQRIFRPARIRLSITQLRGESWMSGALDEDVLPDFPLPETPVPAAQENLERKESQGRRVPIKETGGPLDA